jgi:formylglycine-generating enzyme required for sulfatase activity
LGVAETIGRSAGGEKDAYDNERPQHQVIVTPFKMQSTAVTNEQFVELFDPSHKRERFSPDDACPVVYVNWYMANMFCLWLGPGYRLPTEAEWEFGCRARPGDDYKTTRFWTGDDDTDLAAAGWYWENWGQKERRTHVVGQKPANAFGLYDVHGNVWEWCADYYDAQYYSRFADRTEVDNDPAGPAAGSDRVCRGGGWNYGARGCRSALRMKFEPTFRDDLLGFRLASSSVDHSGQSVKQSGKR